MWQLALACVIDLLIGDPPWMPHPVVWMGRTIGRLDRFLHPRLGGKYSQYITGILLLIVISGGSGSVVWVCLVLAQRYNHWLAFVLGTWLISTTIAIKGLAAAGTSIADALDQGDLERARKLTGMIVSRSTDSLDEQEVARAAVESVAENIVDAVVAPLFYAALGGPILAVMYRAVNTLDSMVGYKNDAYRYFGWASARCDDVLNYIPARITGALLIAGAWLSGFSPQTAWRMMRRDARKHPSPNGGIPESAVAGALGIRLGGENLYHGRRSFREYMGDPDFHIVSKHIRQTVRLLYITSIMMIVAAVMWVGVFD